MVRLLAQGTLTLGAGRSALNPEQGVRLMNRPGAFVALSMRFRDVLPAKRQPPSQLAPHASGLPD